MDNKIIQFKPRAPKAQPIAPEAAGELFWMEHEVAELTLTVAKADPTPPRVRY